MPALPHRRAPCIPFLAHVRVLLHPQGENDGFAQLPHTIRLKRAPHGHAETPPHTLLSTHWQTTTMIMRPRPKLYGPGWAGNECASMPAFDGASGLQAHQPTGTREVHGPRKARPAKDVNDDRGEHDLASLLRKSKGQQWKPCSVTGRCSHKADCCQVEKKAPDAQHPSCSLPKSCQPELAPKASLRTCAE